MTPFGKPASQIRPDDIRQLVEDGRPEDRHLELKGEIPQKEDEGGKRRDRSSRPPPQSLGDYGRDKLLRELVAFANTDGGVLILGIDETDEKPHRATSIIPHANCEKLAEALHNTIISCIEPRLPYASCHAVVTESDGTSGVVIVEIEPSRLGPHWVRGKNDATVRREDKSVGMSMSEIHAMTLRNARKFEDIEAVLTERSAAMEAPFLDYIQRTAGLTPWLGHGDRWANISAQLTQRGQCAYALRLTLAPHQDIGLSRLERCDDLVPPRGCITDGTRMLGGDDVWLSQFGLRRIYGGIETTSSSSGINRYVIRRDGLVEFRWFRCGKSTETPLGASRLAGALGCLLGVYSRLRAKSGFAAAPAELDIELMTCTAVFVAAPSGFQTSEPLPRRQRFDRRTVGDSSDFSGVIVESVGDLLNAAGDVSDGIPSYEFVEN